MVTLAVPVYNMEQYLPRCVDSLLAQTCRDYEILLIDDGSTDSSGTICDGYAAAQPGRVRVIHKENGGLSSARNVGIDNAWGEFIIFPDPDDWVEPDYVEAFLEFQQRYDADLVCLGHYITTDDGSTPGKPDAEPQVMTAEEARRGLRLPPRMQGFCWNKLYRTEIIRSNSLHFPYRMGTTEDLYFTYQYLSHCTSACHAPSRRVYHYYQWGSSATRCPFSSEKMHTIQTYEYIIGECAARDPELAQIARNEICTAAVNLLWEYEIGGESDPGQRAYLLAHIRRQLPGYFHQSQYGLGRKLQALAAAFSPRLFMNLKKTARFISKKNV